MLSSTHPPAVFLMGPTASGKSDLAMRLADALPVEIISVDSALVYRGMDIGTAKPDAATLKAYPHHLVDIRNPDEPYSAADFRADVLPLMAQITARGRLPVLVGGTMLYFKALRDGLADMPPADPGVREAIAARAAIEGWPVLHQQLAQVDPESAARIHPNDPQRLQRALEVHALTGCSLTEWHRRQVEASLPYACCELAIIPPDRSLLHKRIAERFWQMLAAGFIDEVRDLYQRYPGAAQLPALRSVGYRQAWRYLDNEVSYEAMVEQGIIATRQLAKRQLTWLRGWPGLQTIDEPNVAQALKILRASSIS